MVLCVRWTTTLVMALSLTSLGCSKPKTAAENGQAANQPSAQPSATPAAKPAIPVGPPLTMDGSRAMQYAREIVAFGPRWDGSKALDQVRAYIKGKLKGDQVEEDAFVAETSAGKMSMRNMMVRFPGSRDCVIVVGSHYETNYWLRNTKFVGANDGAATSGLLLAIADQLRGKKLEGCGIWLVFFDGEESFTEKWNDNDALWGSRRLAAKWKEDGTSKKVKAFLLADMIGDADLDIQRDTNSTPWLEDVVLQAATRLGYQSHFFADTTTIEGDDHIPFARAGIPVADIIDINYGYNGSLHHSPEDTLDKISPKSLEVSGNVILETIRLLKWDE
jgi:Zn-dependent M28 family amino/carboxypeptidase